MSKENPNEFKIINKNERLKYRQIINQLKQQLEEKDQQIKKRVIVYEKQFIVQTNEIYSLKQQLAEKQNTIDEINKEFLQAVHDWKTLCAEKDKEIASLTNRTNRYENMFRSRINRTGDMQKDIELYVKQLAIQELEKVNEILTDTIIKVTQDEMDLNKLCYLEEISAQFCEKMQDQIKELKG